METKITYTSGGGGYDTLKYYDGNGIMTKQTDWIDGTNGVQYGYDSDGRLTRITDYDGSHLDYGYDSVGRVTSMNDYHGNTVSYSYSSAGTVSTITAPGSKVWTYGYDDVNVLTSLALPNGMTAVYLYDGDGRRTAIQYKDGGTVLRGFTVEYAGPDLITKQTHQDGSLWLYYHDGRDRLTKAERYGTDGTTLLHRFTYTLDDNGNALTKAVYEPRVGTDTQTFAYDAANQLTSQTSGGTTTAFAYDAWGQMTSKTDGTYSATYTYRYEGKLHAVTTDFPGEAGVTYEYGGDGKRRSRVSGAEETWYNWDREWNVVSEEDDADGSSGALSRTYIAGADTIEQVESILADVGGASPATGDYRYYALDHLGSVRGLYDGTKSAVAAAEYDPYGAVYAESGAAMSYAFTGKPYDGASGLHYFPYRYYGPEQMRWMTRDPAEMVDGPNVYLYVAASPVNAVDPLGLLTTCSDPAVRGVAQCSQSHTCGIFSDFLNFLLVPQGFWGGREYASFTSCCCCHDKCYCGDMNLSKGSCDSRFYLCMQRKCDDTFGYGTRYGRGCRFTATVMYAVVSAARFLCDVLASS